MTDAQLPAGAVEWQSDPQANRLCVLISDIHCTDCTVGNQTAEQTDWEMFFEQLQLACDRPVEQDANASSAGRLDELLLILNGDIVDLIRTSVWCESGVYPWDRKNPRFAEHVVTVMKDIVQFHAGPPIHIENKPWSGFFYWMRKTLDKLRAQGLIVHIIPIIGNHDKELQVVPAARQIFYEECLGLKASDISPDYRKWVSDQMGTPITDVFPVLPVYFIDRGLRLFATHGQWRDADNIRPTTNWKVADGWQPQRWLKEQYRPFHEPCFGDTIAAGMLSHFIWSTRAKMPASPGVYRINNLLDEMDLFRPSVAAVVSLLAEAQKMGQENSADKDLRDTILQCFHASLEVWLSHDATKQSAPAGMRTGLALLGWLRHLKWYWVDILLMRIMAKAQEPEATISTADVMKLPAFDPAYRALGLRLHVEGHTHVALQEEIWFASPHDRRNYTYVNLGAWRDAIVPKLRHGRRRRGIARALYVIDLPRLRLAQPDHPEDAYRYFAVDMTSWGDRRDRW